VAVLRVIVGLVVTASVAAVPMVVGGRRLPGREKDEEPEHRADEKHDAYSHVVFSIHVANVLL
jgi:hypothetical protein